MEKKISLSGRRFNTKRDIATTTHGATKRNSLLNMKIISYLSRSRERKFRKGTKYTPEIVIYDLILMVVSRSRMNRRHNIFCLGLYNQISIWSSTDYVYIKAERTD